MLHPLPLLAFLAWPEMVMILAVSLMIFGPKKLPELARGLGKGIREFKKAAEEVTSDLQSAIEAPPAPAPSLTHEAPTVAHSEASSLPASTTPSANPGELTTPPEASPLPAAPHPHGST